MSRGQEEVYRAALGVDFLASFPDQQGKAGHPGNTEVSREEDVNELRVQTVYFESHIAVAVEAEDILRGPDRRSHNGRQCSGRHLAQIKNTRHGGAEAMKMVKRRARLCCVVLLLLLRNPRIHTAPRDQ